MRKNSAVDGPKTAFLMPGRDALMLTRAAAAAACMRAIRLIIFNGLSP
ncbi:hypothetical protein KCP74_18235 [Salmonella enterica subsp. enterica]|nr:hypothetical protein KCP74_18235 [Salmonella enterica subsp. enterica]